MKLLYLFAVLSLSINFAHSQHLRLEFDNKSSDKGTFEIGVFTSAEGFPNDRDPELGFSYTADQSYVDIPLAKLKSQTIAIAIYQDINENGKMDKNFLGIPKEPYGFSLNPRIISSAPSFSECEVNIATTDAITIKFK
jgi:uncharacterized protein (DUF2141 family)